MDEATVSEIIIMTGRHFLSCAACGTYCRPGHNGVVQALHDFFQLEMCFSGRTRNLGSNYVGRQGNLNSDRYTDGQASGSPHTGQVRSGQVRFITRPKSRTMRATRQLTTVCYLRAPSLEI